MSHSSLATDYATPYRNAWVIRCQHSAWPEWVRLFDLFLFGLLGFLVAAVLVVW